MAIESRIIELPDGRDLAWTELGSPEGRPVVVFHGSPGIGYSFHDHSGDAAGADVRLVAPDRPGYGRSTYHRRRTFRSWTDDLAYLADHLRLDRFGVLGHSSGGPNAVACARFLPERLTGCAVAAGPAPPDASISEEGMRLSNRLGRRVCRVAPGFAAIFASRALRRVQRSPDRALSSPFRDLPPCDVAVLAQGERREEMLRTLARASAGTGARAAVQDFALEVHDWGFRLEDLTAPVQVWHGEEDRNVPVVNGVRQADAIPDATLHRLADVGHWLTYDHFVDILAGITG